MRRHVTLAALIETLVAQHPADRLRCRQTLPIQTCSRLQAQPRLLVEARAPFRAVEGLKAGEGLNRFNDEVGDAITDQDRQHSGRPALAKNLRPLPREKRRSSDRRSFTHGKTEFDQESAQAVHLTGQPRERVEASVNS